MAIALAVSWKPFVKSNASAVITTIARISEKPSIYPGNRSSVIGWSNVGNQGEQKMNWDGRGGVRFRRPGFRFGRPWFRFRRRGCRFVRPAVAGCLRSAVAGAGSVRRRAAGRIAA
ncbi:hypothetical protein GCM10010524_16920 [Streptomyces mexicanus]